jgi:hypothetical protein
MTRRLGGNFEIVVEAPSVGLVTRLPGDLPDVRAALVGENVRFENGVMARAPGYGRLVTDPVLDSFPTLIFQSNMTKGDSVRGGNYLVIGTTQKIWSILRYPVDTPVYQWVINYKEWATSGYEAISTSGWTISYKTYVLSSSEAISTVGWTISTS